MPNSRHMKRRGQQVQQGVSEAEEMVQVTAVHS